MNSSKFILLGIISLNIYLLYIFKVSLLDTILNLMISFGVFNYYVDRRLLEDIKIDSFQIVCTFFILFATLYRSFWLHIGDNFIFLLFPLFLIILILLSNNSKNILSNFKPILISLLLPISKVLFIPLSILINPFSTIFTWLALNAFGFTSFIKGAEIFYNNTGINVTFSCSGSGQILFCLSAMIILNFCLPLKNIRLFAVQLFRAFIFTFFANIVRLFLLTIYSYTANSVEFSMFDYLHGGNGGLLFSFFSMLLCCESYKRLYLRRFKLK